MKSMNRIDERQAGVISIFSVMFFMIFISIITVGFVKIIGDEERQSINNDLSASALAAANSGVEEGKRILAYCRSTGTCGSILNNPACNAVTGASFLGSLGINLDPATNEGIISQNSDYLQRWTCMVLNTATDDVVLDAPLDKNIMVPLQTAGNLYTNVQVEWHDTTSSEGIPGGYPAGVVPRSEPDWLYYRYPAGLRIQFIPYPSNNIDIGNVDRNTKTIVLFPATPGVNATLNVNGLDQRVSDPMTRTTPTPQPIHCYNNVSGMPQYACSANLSIQTMSPAPGPGILYFMRVSSIYSSTHIRVTLRSPSGSIVKFDNVQPTVDVTGRANDVFRRVSARLDFTTDLLVPNFAIQSGQTFCKNMLVTDQNATSSDFCEPYPAP